MQPASSDANKTPYTVSLADVHGLPLLQYPGGGPVRACTAETRFCFNAIERQMDGTKHSTEDTSAALCSDAMDTEAQRQKSKNEGMRSRHNESSIRAFINA